MSTTIMLEIAVTTLLAALLSDQRSQVAELLETAFLVPAGAVVHVRIVDPQSTLKPRLRFDPRTPTGWTPEDATCPRICFATTISGALASVRISLQTLDTGGFAMPRRIDVYTNMHEAMMGKPTTAAVPDAPAAGELWALQPIDLLHVGSLDSDVTEALACASDVAEDEAAIQRILTHARRLTEQQTLNEMIQVSRDAIAIKMREIGIKDIP